MTAYPYCQEDKTPEQDSLVESYYEVEEELKRVEHTIELCVGYAYNPDLIKQANELEKQLSEIKTLIKDAAKRQA